MGMHNNTGKEGESLAKEYFIQNGYEILHLNWRHKHWEVDIIAGNGKVLHFIEVKTLSSGQHGYPEEKADVKKIRYLANAAEQFLYMYPQWQRIQFDVLAITLKQPPEYFLIEDVYLY